MRSQVHEGRASLWPIVCPARDFISCLSSSPHLVAGLTERPQNVLHHFYENHRFEYGRLVDGLRQMLWGLFKKVVIADPLALLVDQVYDKRIPIQAYLWWSSP
jgi:D-alanyl-lipoteichoic acid acyltransferase DltB (MBOAT superfamily)